MLKILIIGKFRLIFQFFVRLSVYQLLGKLKMIGNNIVIPHSWHLVNESFAIGIKPDILIHQNIMIFLLLSIPVFTIPTDCTVIYLLFFSKYKKKYGNVFYKFILVFTLVAIYWSCYFFYQGLCQLLGYSLFGELGNIIIATTAQYLFYVCMNMNLLFAFNRFSAVVYGYKHDIIFSNFNGLLYIAIMLVGSAILNIPGFMFLVKYVSIKIHAFIIQKYII